MKGICQNTKTSPSPHWWPQATEKVDTKEWLRELGAPRWGYISCLYLKGCDMKYLCVKMDINSKLTDSSRHREHDLWSPLSYIAYKSRCHRILSWKTWANVYNITCKNYPTGNLREGYLVRAKAPNGSNKCNKKRERKKIAQTVVPLRQSPAGSHSCRDSHPDLQSWLMRSSRSRRNHD